MYARGFGYGSQSYGHYNSQYHIPQQNSPHHPSYQPYIYNAPRYGFNAFTRANPAPFNHITPSPSAIHYPGESRIADLAGPRQSYEAHCHYYSPPSLPPQPVIQSTEPPNQREKEAENGLHEGSASEKLAENCYPGKCTEVICNCSFVLSTLKGQCVTPDYKLRDMIIVLEDSRFDCCGLLIIL